MGLFDKYCQNIILNHEISNVKEVVKSYVRYCIGQPFMVAIFVTFKQNIVLKKILQKYKFFKKITSGANSNSSLGISYWYNKQLPWSEKYSQRPSDRHKSNTKVNYSTVSRDQAHWGHVKVKRFFFTFCSNCLMLFFGENRVSSEIRNLL